VVVEKIVVHVLPSGEAWIWNDLAYAASQFKTTWVTEALAPRSTCSHCGSLNALDHRVPVLPSTAFDAGNVEFSSDDAVAGIPCDNNVDAALALLAGPTASARAAAKASTTPTIAILRPAISLRTFITPELMTNPCLREAACRSEGRPT
jgi:hypothetical protein